MAKKKKKLNIGGGLAQGVSTFGPMVAEFVPQDNSAGGAASGALKGAAAGAALGPWGAAAGAVIGGVTGAIKGRKAEKAATKAEELFKAKATTAIRNNTGPALPTFKNGGQVLDQSVLKGGQLNQIGPDAVQVKANNPQQTDSVEMETAYVDHNEIIDRKNRVFSDSIKAPSGRTIAKEATKLEKMKSQSSRFTAANDHIDQKLDQLFGYQQRLNLAKNKKGLAFGGPLEEGGTEGVDPKTGKPITQPTETLSQGPVYTPQNPATTPEMNAQHAIHNLTLAQRFKNSLKGVNQNVVGGDELLIDGQPTIRNTSANQYVNVDPRAIQKADSVIQAGRPILMKKKGLVGGGDIPPLKDTPSYQQPVFNLDKPWMPSYQQDGMIWENPGTPPITQQNSSIPTMNNPVNMGIQVNNPNAKGLSVTPAAGGGSVNGGGKGFDWQKAGTAAATFGPDAINTFLAAKMKKPGPAALETGTFLNRINADDQLAENRRQTANSITAAKRGISQASNQAAFAGASLAKRLYADNTVKGEVNRQNAQIANQEAALNQGVKARNAQTLNQFNLLNTEADNRQLSAYSQIASNVGNKVLQKGREKNEMKRDEMHYEFLKAKYKDSGIDQRVLEDIMNQYKTKKKNGGTLPKKRW